MEPDNQYRLWGEARVRHVTSYFGWILFIISFIIFYNMMKNKIFFFLKIVLFLALHKLLIYNFMEIFYLSDKKILA